MAKKQSSMESGEGGMMANSSKSKSKGKKWSIIILLGDMWLL